MRKNCQRTLDAWVKQEPSGKWGDSIWTDGDMIYSYSTWIVARNYPGGFVFNATKYSQTTTTHQNAIRAYMESEGLDMKVYDNEPTGAACLLKHLLQSGLRPKDFA